jgi:inward rectifier potassium channel
LNRLSTYYNAHIFFGGKPFTLNLPAKKKVISLIMANKKPNIFSDPGLGEKYLETNKRIINKNGSFNLKRKGDGLFWRDTYQNLINMSWFKFIGLIVMLYFSIYLIFGSLIYFIGTDNL